MDRPRPFVVGCRCQRASAVVSRFPRARGRPVRSIRRSTRLPRSAASRWARSARRMIAQARAVGLRARLSLFSSTTLAPKMAYSSSRRTHWGSSPGVRGRAGRALGLRAQTPGSAQTSTTRPISSCPCADPTLTCQEDRPALTSVARRSTLIVGFAYFGGQA
jgi:hypothetical protein